MHALRDGVGSNAHEQCREQTTVVGQEVRKARRGQDRADQHLGPDDLVPTGCLDAEHRQRHSGGSDNHRHSDAEDERDDRVGGGLGVTDPDHLKDHHGEDSTDRVEGGPLPHQDAPNPLRRLREIKDGIQHGRSRDNQDCAQQSGERPVQSDQEVGGDSSHTPRHRGAQPEQARDDGLVASRQRDRAQLQAALEQDHGDHEVDSHGKSGPQDLVHPELRRGHAQQESRRQKEDQSGDP